MKTSYFARAFKLPRSQFFVVRIAIGSPRGGRCDACVTELAPTWEMLNAGYGQAEYFAKLQQVGVVPLKKRLAEINHEADGREVLLCCFESLADDKVAQGQWCHRRMFAEWWEKSTGQTVEELQP